MSPADTFFIAVAIVDLVLLAVMAGVALQMVDEAKRGKERIRPLVREVRGLAEIGGQFNEVTLGRARRVVRRLQEAGGEVREGLDRTRRLAGEIRPAARIASNGARAAAEPAAGVMETARKASSLARRLGRVKKAAAAAAEAVRSPNTDPQGSSEE